MPRQCTAMTVDEDDFCLVFESQRITLCGTSNEKYMNKMKDIISPKPVFTKTNWNVKFHLARKGLMGNNT